MIENSVVFTPKYRRKVIYNQYKADIRDIIKQLCSYKGVEIIEGHLMPDHIHMLVSIPPKISVSSFMGYLKGKSALMIFDKHANNYIRLWILCRLIADIQLESLQFGIIYRGAISLGNHFHSKNITFSKALIDAYLAESTEAIYPRIIILNTPENDILELAPIIYEYFDLRVAVDDDYLFVDYLGKVVEFYDLLGGDCDYIKWHKKIIEKGIESFLNTEKILRKYAWMMNYHHSKLAPIFGTEICVKNELRNKVIQKLGLHLIDFLY